MRIIWKASCHIKALSIPCNNVVPQPVMLFCMGTGSHFVFCREENLTLRLCAENVCGGDVGATLIFILLLTVHVTHTSCH